MPYPTNTSSRRKRGQTDGQMGEWTLDRLSKALLGHPCGQIYGMLHPGDETDRQTA